MESRVEKIMSLSDNLPELNELFEKNESLYSYLGIKIIKIEKGYVELSLPYSEKITRAGNVVHGGIMMTAVDYAGGITTMTVNDGIDQVTQEVKINFLAPMHKGPFRIEGRVIKPGRTAVVVEIKFFDSENSLGIIALGTWYIIRDRIIKKK
ncbi:PaaI family thioesterase [Ferroplasma sp.]|uniref:PaaI family thioesterase n=1 Tax=Ferroplasma sp. TaxID=2591003 RepID=UPI00307EF583